jgi:hypothetical protein
MCAMTTGTAPPPTPSADLIDRFNAIIDDVLACVAVESMKAAGVPWVLRMILAPLLRRRLARWSTAFSAVMADARAGRGIEPAVAPAREPSLEPSVDPMFDPACEDRQSGGASATPSFRSRSVHTERATALCDTGHFSTGDAPTGDAATGDAPTGDAPTGDISIDHVSDVVALSDRPAAWSHACGTSTPVRGNARIVDVGRLGRSGLPRPLPRGGTWHRGPPTFFAAGRATAFRTPVSLRFVIELARRGGGRRSSRPSCRVIAACG